MGFLAISQPDDCGFLLVRSMKEKGTHSFEIKDVAKYGSIEKALIMKEIKSLAIYKLRNNEDGWVYYSRNALAEKFPYMKPASIDRWMRELEKEGFLKSRIKNKFKYDKTKSYFPTELELEKEGVKMMSSIAQNEQPIAQNEQTIPSHSSSHSSSHSDNMQSKALQVSDDEIQRIAYKKQIDYLIALFKEVNPTYERLFANKTQRAAMERLVKKFGREKVERMIKGLKSIFGKPYAPTITTPYLLEKKLADYISYLKKRSEEKINLIDVSKL